MANEPALAHQNGAIASADATRPFYQAIGNEEAVFKAAYRQGLVPGSQGPDRMRQDPLRRGDGP